MNKSTNPKELFQHNFEKRVYRGLDYLTLFLYVVVVSIGALLADFAIIYAIELSISSEISNYQIVAQTFDWFKIGSAFLALFGAGVHAFFSAWSQIKFEIETAKEPSVADLMDALTKEIKRNE